MSLGRFALKRDVRFSLYKVVKPDHAIITFFDQVFDSGVNKAVRWDHYWTPLRYPLLFKVAYLFDEVFALRVEKDAEGNPSRWLQTGADLQYSAKDRSGALNLFEPADLGAIAMKIMNEVNHAETESRRTGSCDQ